MSERDTAERASSTENGAADGPNATRRTFLKGSSAAAGIAALGMEGSKSASANDSNETNESDANSEKPTNVVLFVGDGQGRSQLDLGRYLKAYQQNAEEFPLNVADVTFNVDRHDAHGSATTYPDDPEEFVADSAATATAMDTAENVPTFATGPNADFFDGTIDNTDIAGAIRERLSED
jgi:alkaline phosphatase